jgi:predicted dehydrogenase
MKCLIVGAGYMATEYIKVLVSHEIKLEVVGRGLTNVNLLKDRFNINAHSGGIEHYIKNNNTVPEFAIIAVSVNELLSTTITLINSGVKNILVEKPLVLCSKDLEVIVKLAKKNKTNIYIAYNRRFYGSVYKLKELITEDGGVRSVHFEFTEWIDVINKNGFPPDVLNKFFIANSTHVVDTVFNLIGKPEKIQTYVSGSSVEWHNSGSIFMGFGESVDKIPFSYSSNWGSPGRWSIEVLTQKRRFYLRPMEQLFVQEHGSVLINEVEFDKELDIKYKPGLYKMIEAFLFSTNRDNLCTLDKIECFFPYYEKIAGYNTK